MISNVLRPPVRSTCAWLAMVMALLAAPAPSIAGDDAEDLARAQALFNEGIRLFNLGRFGEACPSFESSLELYAGIGTRGKLAECYERLGRVTSAWQLYREVERLARKVGNQRRQQVARERAHALEPRLSRLIIDPGSSMTLAEFTVRRNGVLLEPRTYGSAMLVDPGMYIIVAGAADHRLWSTIVQVAEGRTTTARVPALTRIDDAPPEPSSTARIVGYGLVGAGLLALAGSGVFGVRAHAQWERAQKHCSFDLVCDPDGVSLAGDAETSATIANALAGAGVVSVAAGAIMLWRAANRPERPDEALHAIPSVSSSSIGMAVTGRF